MNEDVVGDDEYLDEFSVDDNSNEFLSENGNNKNDSKEEDEKKNKETYDNKNITYDNEYNEMLVENKIFDIKEEVLNIHKKNICGIKLIKNGNTLIISGNDNIVRIYDFKNMNKYEKNYTNFISLSEGSITQSLDGKNNFILIGNGNKCYVYNKNGQLIKNTIRGDMYIKDANNTKGHTRQINCCKFHPFDENIFISGSLDSTLRIWNLKKNICYGLDNELVHYQCLKIVNEKNIMNNNILCCEFNKEGDTIIVGCDNGQVEIRNKISNDYTFSYKSNYTIKKNIAHKNSIIDILASKKNNNFFFTRSLDNTIKYWDMRNLKESLNTIEGVETIINKSNICFFDSEKYIIVGTQEKKIKQDEKENYKNFENQTNEYIKNRLDLDENKINDFVNKKKLIDNYVKIYKGDDDMNKYLNEVASINKMEKDIHGKMKIYDINNFNLVYTKKYENAGIICTYYDQCLNHLFLGTTEGTCLIYYGSNSKNGVLDYINKSMKRKEDNSFYMNSENIYNMDDLPKEIQITQSGNVLIRKNHNKKAKINPDLNMLNNNAYEKKKHIDSYSNFITDVYENKKDKKNNNEGDEEENIVNILRKREMNKKGEDYFLKAYKYTQPKNIINYSSDEEQEYSKFLKKQKCPQCGIKNCVCGYMKNIEK
ncbi:WD-repeat protein, putative [Plasmodium gallinaceum]|uniref:WD-repeat protein, putative n=1 Tax=Plasmodium gallinaceum TaxID=5849 RepID=A0A1J1GYF9_PLAGA|nr:WD-repeat protein, putative [Plasmodium gallinaceum]CRG97351.1 WD-repeat protein, putative [Plasmodium gallinaceum]